MSGYKLGDREGREMVMRHWPQAKDRPAEKRCGRSGPVRGLMADAVLRCVAEDGHDGDHRFDREEAQ